jgi:hypothetical protein
MRFKTRLISYFVLSMIARAQAELVHVGTVYPIAEPDALTEIESRARGASIQDIVKQSNRDWLALHSERLRTAPADRVRRYIPFYILEMDIVDAKGSVIYPRGFRFNPLDHLMLPSRIAVITESQAPWLKHQLRGNEMVILTEGDRVKVSKDLNTPVFILDTKTKERLSLEFVPSIVEQKGNELIISEFTIKDAKNAAR